MIRKDAKEKSKCYCLYDLWYRHFITTFLSVHALKLKYSTVSNNAQNMASWSLLWSLSWIHKNSLTIKIGTIWVSRGLETWYKECEWEHMVGWLSAHSKLGDPIVSLLCSLIDLQAGGEGCPRWDLSHTSHLSIELHILGDIGQHGIPVFSCSWARDSSR